MNQHYVSQVLLRRFKKPGSALQRYRVQTADWKPRKPENVFSARAWNQLRLYGQIDDSLEAEFSKVETDLPDTLEALEKAALTCLTQLPQRIHQNLCRYCTFLWLTSPFAKAKAPINFLLQVNFELQDGKSELLRSLTFPEETIEAFRKARALGQYAILYSDDALQLVYRMQFRYHYPTTLAQFLHWSHWTICNSPVELPLSDVALVQLHEIERKAIYYVLPIGPTLLLKGKFNVGPQEALPPQLRGETLSRYEAEYWREIICLSAVSELVSPHVIPDILTARERAKANGIRFPKIVNPQRGVSLGLTEFNAPFGLRMVSEQQYVKYVHSFLQPTTPGQNANEVPNSEAIL